MARADVAMLCSALLRHGIDRLRVVRDGMERFMTAHDSSSIARLNESVSQRSRTAFERATSMKAWTGHHLTSVPVSMLPDLRRVVLAAPLCEAIAGLLRSPGPLSAFAVGIFNGFVPCGAVYAMLLQGVAAGVAGTRLAASRSAGRLAWAAAWAPIALGLLTLWRTLGGASSHLHASIAQGLTP